MFQALRAFFSTGDGRPQQIYGKLVAWSRAPAFYAKLGVPDTVEGRYDMLVLHAVVLFCRLRQSEDERNFAQDMFDAMFADLDRGLREEGVGDLSVPKRIKKLAQAFYGRAEAYDDALTRGARDELAGIISRNIYRQPLQDVTQAKAIADYALELMARLQAASFDDIRAGRMTAPDV